MLDGDEFVAFTFAGDFQHDTDARGVELIVVGLQRFGSIGVNSAVLRHWGNERRSGSCGRCSNEPLTNEPHLRTSRMRTTWEANEIS